MAFVLVQHLAPTHSSLLDQILARSTHMMVQQVTENMLVERDHVRKTDKPLDDRPRGRPRPPSQRFLFDAPQPRPNRPECRCKVRKKIGIFRKSGIQGNTATR